MANFKEYNKLKKTLSKKEKRELRDSIFFLRTAITCTLAIEGTELYSDYIDDNGWAEFYEIIMEICDEVLLSNDSTFLTYIKLYLKGEAEDDYFNIHFSTCYDWYFMDLARKELSKRMFGEE
jgi:hypothetical protein